MKKLLTALFVLCIAAPTFAGTFGQVEVDVAARGPMPGPGRGHGPGPMPGPGPGMGQGQLAQITITGDAAQSLYMMIRADEVPAAARPDDNRFSGPRLLRKTGRDLVCYQKRMRGGGFGGFGGWGRGERFAYRCDTRMNSSGEVELERDSWWND